MTLETVSAAAGIAACLAIVFADRPERRPGILPPIQLVTSIGAWGLVLSDAVLAAIALRTGALALAFVAMAMIATMPVVFLLDRGGSLERKDVPASIEMLLAEIRALIGGASRLGFDQIDAAVARGHDTGLRVSIIGTGRVLILIGPALLTWLDRHRQGGVPRPTMSTFLRFMVLHELGHVLNRDYLTYRFVRSVLLAHVWLICALPAVGFLLLTRPEIAAGSVASTIMVVLLFVVQCLIARRFVGEREELADWRAMQTLAPAEVSCLTARRRNSAGLPSPSEIEKLLTDLKADVPARRDVLGFARIALWIWPEGGDLHARAERACGDGRRAPKPVLWASLMGLQCGIASACLAMAIAIVIGSLGTELTSFLALRPLVACGLLIAPPAATYCAIRVDPALMIVRRIKRVQSRLIVGMGFVLAFSGAWLAISRFAVRVGFGSAFSLEYVAAVLGVLTMPIGMCISLGAIADGEGGGELRSASRETWVGVRPTAVVTIFLVPLSALIASQVGLGPFRSGAWIPVMLFSFSLFVVSTGFNRSTSTVLQAMAPFAVLDSPSPVYGFRFAWRDAHLDLARIPLWRAIALATSMQFLALLVLSVGTAVMMQAVARVFGGRAAFLLFFVGGMAVMSMILMIPDRYRAFAGPQMRLLDRQTLLLLARLFESVRSTGSTTASCLEHAIRHWLNDPRLPGPLLPDQRTLWMLTPLLTLVRLARATTAIEALQRWRDPIARALSAIVVGGVVPVAPGKPPSLYYTALATTIAAEMQLRTLDIEKMTDRTEELLMERIATGTTTLVADIIAAADLLQSRGLALPAASSMVRFTRSLSLTAQPALQQSLVELHEIGVLAGDAAYAAKLLPLVRSRAWELLQLNPRKEVLPLLDCYLAAVRLGEGHTPLMAAAGGVITEIAQRTSDDLFALASGPLQAADGPPCGHRHQGR